MSHMKTIQKNKAKAQESVRSHVVHQGGVDVLHVSPEPGNPQPHFVKLRPEQVSSDAGKVLFKFLKDYKKPDGSGWEWSYEHGTKVWHNIDNLGTVRSSCPPMLPPPSALTFRLLFHAARFS